MKCIPKVNGRQVQTADRVVRLLLVADFGESTF